MTPATHSAAQICAIPPLTQFTGPMFEAERGGIGRGRSPQSNGRDALKGQEAIFKRLINEYQASLYYFVLKRVGHADDAAEITQQAFVEAACAITSYRGEAELSTWIFGIATNLARNHLNRAPSRRHRFESDDALENCESPFSDPSVHASQQESLRLASEAMNSLPREMSEALSLVAIDGLSYEEAAAELSVPVGTVRSRVSRARTAMRNYFRKAGATEGY